MAFSSVIPYILAVYFEGGGTQGFSVACHYIRQVVLPLWLHVNYVTYTGVLPL